MGQIEFLQYHASVTSNNARRPLGYGIPSILEVERSFACQIDVRIAAVLTERWRPWIGYHFLCRNHLVANSVQKPGF